jgi:hypothetical protein
MRNLHAIKLNFWFSGIFLGLLAGGAMFLIYKVSHSEAFIADISATRVQNDQILKGRDFDDVDLYKE